ncbi:hypothetical protein BU15DRAFT_67790 [Melanogaster broomeanus]|nr:hypothetical protein BU15DRAFT_67790 [Melanogaster broomeanus]
MFSSSSFNTSTSSTIPQKAVESLVGRPAGPTGKTGKRKEDGAASLSDKPETSADVASDGHRLGECSSVQNVGVLEDMVDLGIELETVQWGIVAGAYAHVDPVQHKNNRGADDGRKNHQQNATRHPAETLLATYTGVMKKLIDASQLEHARQVEKRLVKRFGYRTGDRKATDAAIRLLRRRERKELFL